MDSRLPAQPKYPDGKTFTSQHFIKTPDKPSEYTKSLKKNKNTVHREIIALVLYPSISPLLSAEELEAGRIPKSQIISLLIQLCKGEFKTVRNCLQV